MYSKSDFSFKLDLLRRNRGFSMAQIAQMLDVSFEAVRLMVRGKRSPSIEVLDKLVMIFDVPVDFFLSRPPFEDWAGIQHCRSMIEEITSATFGLDAEWLKSLSEPEFIRIFGALYAKAVVHPEENTVELYPLIPPGHFLRR